ncbi:hypothetical protein BKA93DRAFT_822856 [Sparassis latifolia]
MPQLPITKHRIQRQYQPSSGCVRFDAERLLTPPPSSARSKFHLIKPQSDVQAGTRQSIASDAHSPGADAAASEPIIPKPDGQVGRPGRGGYTLSDELGRHGWDTAKYDKFLKDIGDLAVRYLELDKTISKQNQTMLDAVYAQAMKLYPQLAHYEKSWPVRDVLKTKLGNTTYMTKKDRGKEQEARASVAPAVL